MVLVDRSGHVGRARLSSCWTATLNASSLDGDAARRFPGIAAHLSNCNPCVQDFEGLVAAIGGPAGWPLPGR